jgi:hypothetical protein
MSNNVARLSCRRDATPGSSPMQISSRLCENAIAVRRLGISGHAEARAGTNDPKQAGIEQQGCLLPLRHGVFTRSARILHQRQPAQKYGRFRCTNPVRNRTMTDAYAPARTRRRRNVAPHDSHRCGVPRYPQSRKPSPPAQRRAIWGSPASAMRSDFRSQSPPPEKQRLTLSPMLVIIKDE